MSTFPSDHSFSFSFPSHPFPSLHFPHVVDCHNYSKYIQSQIWVTLKSFLCSCDEGTVNSFLHQIFIVILTGFFKCVCFERLC
jgi:hypothetical protein